MDKRIPPGSPLTLNPKTQVVVGRSCGREGAWLAVLDLTESRWFSVHSLGVRQWFAGTAEAPREAPWGPSALVEGFPRIAFPLQESCWVPCFWLVGAQGSQRFSSAAQSSKPS